MKRLIKKIVPESLINLGFKIIELFKIKYYSLICGIIIRKNTSDETIFRSIFFGQELNLPVKINPKLIIDGGAYTGYSTLYFSWKYPCAKIFAIEPEDSNFTILEKNTKKYRNIIRLKAGLWYKDTFLKIDDNDYGKWGFRVKEVSESDNSSLKSVTITDLLERSGFDRVDILKLDIEGSEKDLFSKNYKSWIDKVDVIILELHDRINDGCTSAFYSAVDKNKWDEYKNGEKVIMIRKNVDK